MSSAERPTVHLATEHVVAGYGEAPVIKDVSLEVSGGQVYTIVGPNGAGKSTLLKALLGIVRVREGRVVLNGQEITNRPLEHLAHLGVGYVPQSDDVFDTLRVHENLEMGGYILDAKRRAERMEVVLEIFPALKSMLQRYAGTLSGGERKMVAVARVLMPDPTALFLDEPTAGLSPELTRRVLEEQVRVLADLGKAVLIVEQKAEAALKIADHAMVLVTGTVALEGSGQEMRENPEVTEIFLGGGRAPAAPAPS